MSESLGVARADDRQRQPADGCAQRDPKLSRQKSRLVHAFAPARARVCVRDYANLVMSCGMISPASSTTFVQKYDSRSTAWPSFRKAARSASSKAFWMTAPSTEALKNAECLRLRIMTGYSAA